MFSVTLADEIHPGCMRLDFKELCFPGQRGAELGPDFLVNEK